MERPPLASCWVKTRGMYLYRHMGKFIVWRKWRTSKIDKKTGERESEEHEEVIDLDAWNPTGATAIKAKAKIIEAIAEMTQLTV